MDDERIRDYFESSRHRGALADATHTLSHRNPTCGDEVTLSLRINDGIVNAARFQARGCIISQAAAAMLCERIEGQSIANVEALQPSEMLALIGIPLTARRIQCGLLPFETDSEATKHRRLVIPPTAPSTNA